MADHDTIRSMDAYRRRYFPDSQKPHDWERSDRCRRCDRPFDDPLHQGGAAGGGETTSTCRHCGIAIPDGGEYAFDALDGVTYHYCPDSDACEARQARRAGGGETTPGEDPR